jgi:hypothetical protein
VLLRLIVLITSLLADEEFASLQQRLVKTGGRLIMDARAGLGGKSSDTVVVHRDGSANCLATLASGVAETARQAEESVIRK